MQGDGLSELPLHYDSKTSDGELIKRPNSPILPNSPGRSYQPSKRLAYSPERTPIDLPYSSGNPEDFRGAGLRRRPSQNPTRRHSGGDYDLPRPSVSVDGGSRRPLRSRDDGYYRDEERGWSRRDEYAPHPDSQERSRPPRTYRNVEGWERGPSSASKAYFEESRYERDLERGREDWSPEKKRISDEDSVDGYNYDAHRGRQTRGTIDFKSLSPEERAEVLRLPWTQWMNSGVKNRKSHPFFQKFSSNREQISSQQLESSLALLCFFSLPLQAPKSQISNLPLPTPTPPRATQHQEQQQASTSPFTSTSRSSLASP